MNIDEEIQQSSWKSPLQKAMVNTLYTSRFLEDRTSKVLKPFGLTHQQFNVLRILRGQKGNPATVKLLTERMLDKSSNASRLVDKLLDKGLVQRCACSEDRRAVEVRINQAGLDLLERIDLDAHEKSIPVFTDDEAEQLSALLDKLRNAMRG